MELITDLNPRGKVGSGLAVCRALLLPAITSSRMVSVAGALRNSVKLHREKRWLKDPSELFKLVKVISTCLEGPDIWRGWGMSCLPPPTNPHRAEHLQKREEISTPDSNSKIQ
jgi:hypothetical protein